MNVPHEPDNCSVCRPIGQCDACGSDDVRLYEVDRYHEGQRTAGSRLCSGCIGIAIDYAPNEEAA